MAKTTVAHSGQNDRRMVRTTISAFLSALLIVGCLPAEALAEAADKPSGSDEAALVEAPADAAEALGADATADASEGRDGDASEQGMADVEPEEVLPEADLAAGDEAQAVEEAQPTDAGLPGTEADASSTETETPAAEDQGATDLDEAVTQPEVTAQASSTYAVAFKVNGGAGAMDEQVVACDVEIALAANAFARDGYAFAGWNTKADGSGTSYEDGQAVRNLATAGGTVTLYAQWKELPRPVELTAQATGTAETIKKAGFIVTLPKAWGKVTTTSSTLSGQNVGTLTNVFSVDGGGMVIIHCAKRSQFKRVTGWGDVCLIGRKTGRDYIVEVYMTCWPWMDFELDSSGYNNLSDYEMARASTALSMLTGGAYTSCGGPSSASYKASFAAAKRYVKKNVLDKVVLRGANKWVQSGSRWWYSLADGTYPTSTFRDISGARYYFDASGWMVTGWRKISGTWYYFNSDGKMARSAWVKSGSSWYRVDKNGKMLTGLRTVGKQQYYFEKSGVMATGWRQISKQWYYFDASGAMVRGAWVGNYYLQANGTMARSTWIGKYHVNENGLWDKTR